MSGKHFSRRRRSALVVALLLCIGSAAVASADNSSKGILEVNVFPTSKFSMGEPEIAVNPLDPDNLVYVSTEYRYVGYRPAGEDGPAVDLTPGTQILTNGLFESMNCFVAFSDDGGETWTAGRWPNGDRPHCGDPMVAVDTEGTFYILMDWMGGPTFSVIPSSSQDQIAGLVDNGIGVITSTDKGRTWHRYGAAPTNPDGTANPDYDQPTETGTEVDRPYFRLDLAHPGHVYEQSGFSGRTLAFSEDHGVNWTPPVAFPGGKLAVYDGLLATASQQSGQLMLLTSTDRGQSYTSHVVTGATGGSGDWISADPTERGRFALMQRKGDNYELFVTPDAGVSWTGPITIAAPGASKPWMDYGDQGVLGVMWKGVDADGTSPAVWSAIYDDGEVRRVKVNQSPTAFNSGPGDDLSWITLHDDHAYLGWGDTRHGFTNPYFARIPLDLYK